AAALMDFDGKHVVALHKTGGRETERALGCGCSYDRAGKGRIAHGSRRHVPPKSFQAVQVKDRAVVNHVGHHQSHACWISRKIKMGPEVNRRLLGIEKTDV